MLAEAEAEQVAGTRAELDEVALVVVAVLEPVIVERLGQDGRHLVAGDVRDERAHIRAHVRVCRAQVGRVEIAERVAGGAVRVLVGAVGVQEDGPGVDAEPAGGRRPTRVCEHVVLTRERAEAGLDPKPVVAGRIGAEEELTPLEEVDLATRVVREDVAGGVIDESWGNPVQPASFLEIAEHCLDALVGQVRREGERRRLQTR